MKEPKRRRSLSGAVLVMILTVMFVLIILLTAMLTTVTTANQRIYTKFEENQAYYTARSALDVFTQNMLNDGNYDSGETYTYWNPKAHGGAGAVDNVTMKQGLALQLDLYELKSADGVGLTQNVLSNVTTGINEREQYKHHYGVIDGATPPTEYVYEIEFPKLSDGSNEYGKIVDTSSKATITVEVLERMYDLGDYTPASGVNAGVNIKDKVASLSDTTTPTKIGFLTTAANASDIANAMENGNRKNDKMKVKITAKAVYSGVEGLATVIIDTSKPPVTNSSKAVTTFGTAGGHNVNLIGGAASSDNVSATNNPHVYGDVYFEKNYSVTSTSPIYTLYENGSFFVGGDFVTTSNGLDIKSIDPTGLTGEKAPFLYVNGKLKPENFKINQGIDVIAASGVEDVKNGLTVNGNLYVKGDFKATNQFSLSGNGKIYIDGNLIVSENGDSTSFDYKAGDPPIVTIGSGFTGQIYLKGGIYTESAPANDLTAYVEEGKLQTSTQGFTLPTYDDIKNADATEKFIEITLPGNIKKKLPNTTDSFGNYYRVDSSGNVIKDPPSTGDPVIITAEELAFVSPEDRKLGVTTTTTFENFYAAENPEAITQKFTNELGWYLGTDSVDFVAEKISDSDTEWVNKIGGGNYQITFSGNGSMKPFYITADTDLFFAPGTYNDLKFYAADGVNVRIFGTQSSGSYNFGNCIFAHRDIYNKTKASPVEPIYVGAQGSDMIIPNFQFFFGDGSTLDFTNDTFVTGYIQSPKTIVNIRQSNSTTLMSYNDSPTFNERVKIVGSVLCKDLNPGATEQTGIAYVNPDADSSKPGMPHLTIKPDQYIRS